MFAVVCLVSGLVVGGAVMAIIAANRIGIEAARQFEAGVLQGRWLADVAISRVDGKGRSARIGALLGTGSGTEAVVEQESGLLVVGS